MDGATEQTDGGESPEPPPSFTTLSTIAIQAGQSQITVSVLRVGKEPRGHLRPNLTLLLTFSSNRREEELALRVSLKS